MTQNKEKLYRSGYPIYVPSKNRAKYCLTADWFLKEKIDFRLVVEPGQYPAYAERYDPKWIITMPKDNMRLMGTRLWIREHSIKNGHKRHWQFDDNIRDMYHLKDGKLIPCHGIIGIKAVEQFTDRYTNIGISGFNYEMFVTEQTSKPFYLNCHVYSASLINNEMPYKWRLYYNDDTDLCLQVLTNGLCTVNFNVFCVTKQRTMTIKGGNTDDLYKRDGRLMMARALEEVWPEYVKTTWRFGRPQHSVAWRKHFNHPLERRRNVDWEKLENENPEWYKGHIVARKQPKSERMKSMYQRHRKDAHSGNVKA